MDIWSSILNTESYINIEIESQTTTIGLYVGGKIMDKVYNLTCHLICHSLEGRIVFLWTKPFGSFKRARKYAKEFSSLEAKAWPYKKSWTKKKDQEEIVTGYFKFIIAEQLVA